MNAPLYTRDILRLAATIPHLGLIDPADGRATLRSPTCGAAMTVTVRLDEAGRIAAFGQEVEACAFGQASASLVGANAPGRDRTEIEAALTAMQEWLDGHRDDPGGWPGLEALAPARSRRGRHGALLLPLRTLLAAMEEVTR